MRGSCAGCVAAAPRPVAPPCGRVRAPSDTDRRLGVIGSEPSRPALTYTTKDATPRSCSCSASSPSSFLVCSPICVPAFDVESKSVPIDMTTTIVLVMFVVGALILFIGQPNVSYRA